MHCEFNLEKNYFSMEDNDQLAKDEVFSDKKFTNDLTQEIKLVGQQMSYYFILTEWQEIAKESMELNKPLDLMFLFLKTKHMKIGGCQTKFLLLSLKLSTHYGYVDLIILKFC
jgi:hypothetical protein